MGFERKEKFKRDRRENERFEQKIEFLICIRLYAQGIYFGGCWCLWVVRIQLIEMVKGERWERWEGFE